MTKETIKKTVSTLVAMAAILLTVLFVSPVKGNVVGTLGDEDYGIIAYGVIEADEML